MPIVSASSEIVMPGRVRTSSRACLERAPLPRGRPRPDPDPPEPEPRRRRRVGRAVGADTREGGGGLLQAPVLLDERLQLAKPGIDLTALLIKEVCH